MLVFPVAAAVLASFGWATGIVLAQGPARMLGAFEFTRIQLVACSAILAALCSVFGYWPSVIWSFWPSYVASICFGIVLGNLAMIECLRRAGPRRTELLMSLKAPVVGVFAYFWLQEVPTTADVIGAGITLAGVGIAIFFGARQNAEPDAVTGSLTMVLLLGLAATGFQGFGFLVMKPAMMSGSEPMAVSAIRLLGAALLISLVALWPADMFRGHTDMTPGLLGRTILPGFIGYGVSSTLLLYAFANFNAGIAAVLGSLSPVLVLPILWIRDRRAPNARAIVGACLAVSGTAVIVLF